MTGEITDAQATGDAGDNTITAGEVLPVDFTTADLLDGNYTYLGHEPSIPGYVAQAQDGAYYLFSNQTVALNQNFNIQPETITVCFMAGTLIACPSGERAVETLAPGDLILTADGETRAVRWIGRQTVVAFFASPRRAYPVRIAAGALADHVPVRDLFVSPSHALLIDGLLVQAGAIVNGSSIQCVADPGERFTYFHIETADHALILAEGTVVETFVDNVTRETFDNYAEYVEIVGDSHDPVAELDMPRVMSHRQVPPAIHARLQARASMLNAVAAEAA